MHSVIFNIVVMLAAASARPQPWGVWAQMQRSNQAQPRQYFVKTDQEFQPSEYPGYDFSNSEGQSSFDQIDVGQSDFGQSNFGGQGNFDSPGQFEDQGHFMGLNLKSHAYPVHQHVEESNPEPIKHYKEVVVPIPQNVEFKVNQPVLIPVPHPVPIHVPVPKAVVIPIVKEVSIPVEKSIPYPVHKIVHYPKIKEVPFEVVKHVIVTVDKPVPFKVPVYETILHTKKGSHKI